MPKEHNHGLEIHQCAPKYNPKKKGYWIVKGHDEETGDPQYRCTGCGDRRPKTTKV